MSDPKPVGPALNAFLDGLARDVFGMTRAEALAQGVCISCKRPATWTTPEGEREYHTSAFCEPCFERETEGQQ